MALYIVSWLSFVAFVSALRSAPNWTSTKLHPQDVSQFCGNINNRLIPEGLRVSGISDNKYVKHIDWWLLVAINVNFKYSIKVSSTNGILQLLCLFDISIMGVANQSEDVRTKMQSDKQHHIDTHSDSKGICCYT